LGSSINADSFAVMAFTSFLAAASVCSGVPADLDLFQKYIFQAMLPPRIRKIIKVKMIFFIVVIVW